MENGNPKIPFIPSVDRIIVVLFEIALVLMMAGSIYFEAIGFSWFRYVIYLIVILSMFATGLFVNSKDTMTKDQERWALVGIAVTIMVLVVALVMVLTGVI
jgi:predicted Na+-dependent transporter